MTNYCKICLTEAVNLDDWFLKIEQAHGKTTVIECVCPWCVEHYFSFKEMPAVHGYDKDKKKALLLLFECMDDWRFCGIGFMVGKKTNNEGDKK